MSMPDDDSPEVVSQQMSADYPQGPMTEEQQRTAAAAVRAETSPGLIMAAGFALAFGLILLASQSSSDATSNAVFGGLLVLSLLLAAAVFWRRQRLLAEVQAGQLEHATGHVEWKGGRYQAQVPGRTLDLTNFNLAAGSYHFSYLPRSGRVVSARLAAADSPTQAHDELQHALAVANHFNVDDLPAYREGKQGPGRFRRLRRLWSTAGWLLLAAYGLALVFTIMVVADQNSPFAPMVILVAMLLFFFGLGSVLGDLRPTLDIFGGRVLSSRGQVQKFTRVIRGRYTVTLYFYTLNGQDWRVSPEAWRALIEGRRYRVYYLPRSKALVGIEPMED
jgi:hypothetical protein